MSGSAVNLSGAVRRRIYPGLDQALLRGGIVLGAAAAVIGAQAAGARPAWWEQATLLGLAVLLALRPDSSAGVAVLLGTAYLWWTVPHPLSPLVLLTAAGMVLTHVCALVAAQGPPQVRVDPDQARRWLRRGLLLWGAATLVWALDLVAAGLPGGRLAYAAGLTVLVLLAGLTVWLLSPRP